MASTSNRWSCLSRKKIAENKGNLEAFLDMLANLSVEQVQSQKYLTANDEEQKNILEKAFAFF